MTLEFSQIHRNDHLPGRIAAEIAREINDSKLGPGDRLPTEHVLAKTFGVSRSVIREAIAQLRNCATKVLSKHGKAWALSSPIPGRDCPFASSGPV